MFLLTEPGIASVELSSLVQLEGVFVLNFDRLTMTAVTDSDLGHMSAHVSCQILGP